MMRQHQELKAKIDGRSKTIQQCADLGKILIAAGNPASEEVWQKKNIHTVNIRIHKNHTITLCSNETNLPVAADKREVGQSSD